ncbi:MAG: PilC/PilY family type IV pilus protein [Syntrophales bacterium]|nr:PilC/PilY family type IV pilus protein [Syntrophales bacterium]
MEKTQRINIISILVTIAMIVGIFAASAEAQNAEEDMFTQATQPDALILLDLSGSMDGTPSGGYQYGSSSACTANTTACAGVSSTYHYGSNAEGTADPINCVGAPNRSTYPYAASSTCAANTTACAAITYTYPYAHDSTGAANTYYCKGTGCSGGYCSRSKTGCSTRRGTDCSGGFCKTSIPGCNVNCNYNCSGGFCATSKPGCDVNLSTSRCSGGFCQDNSQPDCSVDCSKLAIAKRSIFNFLDDNNDGQITAADKTSLGVRMGYMRWYSCSNSSTTTTGQEGRASPTYNYSTGCNTIVRGIDAPYSAIYCGNDTSCSSSAAGSGTSSTVSGESASGGTPLSSGEVEAKLYLDAHKLTDAAAACRNKFVILITDGADTYACGGSGSTTDAPQRRESVAKAKDLADAGYKVFVIGFGAAMPDDEKNTLNWMAYYGRTDDPNTANTGTTTSYAIPSGSLYPTGVASCSISTSYDPGLAALGGYAYIAADADQLAAALKSTINIIRQANYSFSQSSIQASRTTDENYLYEGSFEPAGDDTEPFWKGRLKKYQINYDGTVGVVLWDAASNLQTRADTTRTIKTYKGGALTSFTTANITPTDVGTTTASDPDIALETDLNNQRDAVVGYIRGEAAYNPDVYTSGSPPWKLGDVFRSAPITIGTPSTFFNDTRDCRHVFSNHRTNHERSSANGNRLIVLGANDGQLHAFKSHAVSTFDSTTETYTYTASSDDGSEAWSFIPPNMLLKLKNITHDNNPANKQHQYYVDGPITVADIWDGTSTTGCGTSCSINGACKADNSWKTILVFGEGRGAISYAWSTSASCDTGLSGNYSVTSGSPATTAYYPYYCGYHALNVTDTLNPAYMWHLNFTSDTNRGNQAPYIGDPWSKMMIGRILVKEGGEEKEKWVGFIGAGCSTSSDCTNSGSATFDARGKGFFVVDMANGNILWSYTHQNNAAMDYNIPATPTIVDTDGDGFIDTAYIGDVGGNIWRFTFCREQDMPNCAISGSTTNWGGGKFFDAIVGTGNNRPVYTTPSVAKDASSNLWVYWGTGNKMAPTSKTGIQEFFYGVKDNRSSTPVNAGNVTNLTVSATSTYNTSGTDKGFRIQLANPDIGEKVLSDSTIFGGILYFTTYTPSSGSDACNQAGDAKLYGINYTTGGGAMSGGDRSIGIGSGIPSAPVISMNPGSTRADLYVTTSGTGSGTGSGTTTDASTQRKLTPSSTVSRTNLLYWKDLRIQ